MNRDVIENVFDIVEYLFFSVMLIILSLIRENCKNNVDKMLIYVIIKII